MNSYKKIIKLILSQLNNFKATTIFSSVRWEKLLSFSYFSISLIIILIFNFSLFAQKDNPLELKKLDSPRETISVFINSMNNYRQGMEIGDRRLQSDIDKAVRCLNLEDISYLLRNEKGQETAILLKEVMDRTIFLDFKTFPDKESLGDKPIQFWNINNTEIQITRVNSGEREGEYLFSKGTIARAYEFYAKTKHLKYIHNTKGAGYKEPWLESNLPSWSKQKLLRIYIWEWILILLIFIIGFVIKYIASLAINMFMKLAEKTESKWDDEILHAIKKPASYLASSIFWFICLYFIDLEGNVINFFNRLNQLFFTISIIWFLYNLTEVLDMFLVAKTQVNQSSSLDRQVIPLITKSLKVFTIIFGFLIALQNMGINVVSLLAGLGVGGLALALAAKDMAANLFGSIMIFLDKPFQIGDQVLISGIEGFVEEIGFRSTRIRTFTDSLVTIPNSEVANSKIDNLGLRRVKKSLINMGITYDTPPDKIEAFLEGIKNILIRNLYIQKDSISVMLKNLGISALEISAGFALIIPESTTESFEKQKIFFEILNLSNELKISFAYPTQTLHVETLPEKNSPKREHNETKEQLKIIAEGFDKDGKYSKPEGNGIFHPPIKERK